MDELLTDDVVDGVLRHMNDDHAEDGLRIVRGLAGRPDATAVEAVHLTAAGMVFRVESPTGPGDVTVPWDRELRARADIRASVVAMHDRAVEALAEQGD